MNIIPAIDILDGKCVRLSRGDYATQKIYNEDPLEVALAFEAHGISHLHLVDLDGARSKHIVNHKVLEKITCKTTLVVDFGGGLKTAEDLQKAFDHGAAQVTLGSIAVTDPDLFAEWLSIYGAEQIILGADCNQRKIATHGWLQQSSLDVLAFIKGYAAKGISTVTCTDIAKDGMLQGPSLELYRDILQAVPVQLIASGGITSLADLEELQHIGCAGAIIGKAIYEGHITLKELSALC